MKRSIQITICLLFTLAMTMFLPILAFANEKPVEWVDITWGNNDYKEVDLPDGLVGKSYPVPICVAVDNNGNTISDLQTFVVSPDGNFATVNDGRFETPIAGVYLINYSVVYKEFSCDKQIKVNVVENCDPLYYTISDKMQTSISTGSDIVIYDGEYGGGLGDITVDFSAKYNGESTAISDFGGRKFIPTNISGNYEITFTATDFVGNQVTSVLPVSVTDSLYPIMKKVDVPSVQLVGATLNFPVVDAELYVNGKSYLVPVKVMLDGEDITNNASFTPDATDVGQHVLRYIAGNPYNSGYVSELVYDIKVIDSGDTSMYGENYHYINNFISITNGSQYFEKGMFAFSGETGKDANLSFSNKIHNNYLGVEFSVSKDKDNFEYLEFIFSDIHRADEVVKISLFNVDDGKAVDMFVNGIKAATLDYKFGSDEYMKIKIDCLNNTLVDGNGKKLCDLPTYENGRPFMGFSSKYVYFDMNILGVTGENEVLIKSLAEVFITATDVDGTAPVRILDDKFNSRIVAEIGEVVVLPMVKFYDFLDANVSVNLTISDNVGKIVYDGPMTEDYELTIENYGKYSVTYTASDPAYNYLPIYSTIYVNDRIAPTITVEAPEKEYEVGQTVIFPTEVISDNIEEDLVCYIFISSADMDSKMLKDRTFVFEKEGEYLVKYVVTDKAMNKVVLEFKVTCR